MVELEELKQIIAEAENIVFFGGAGVSTASGIPDFRGSGGLYTAHSGYDGDGSDEFGTDPETSSDEAPEVIFTPGYLRTNPKRFFSYYRRNMVHPYAEPNDAHFALAELERQGKLSAVITQNIDGLHQEAGSENVIELHGSVLRNYCTRCGKEHPLAHVLESDEVPRCKACGGMVRPAASLVELFEGEHLIIINQSPTPYDEYAEYVIRDSIADVLRELVD